MKVLITGFEPFDKAEKNPSWEAVKLLPESHKIVKIELPVVFEKAAELLWDEVIKNKPDAIIMVGVAGNRDAITPEVIAVNIDDARIPDNDGSSPQWQKIDENGPDGIFSSLPVKDMVEKMGENGIKASLSYTAGAYVCNDLFYRTLNNIKKNGLDIRAGFIHVPMPKDYDAPHVSELSLNDIAKGLQICKNLISLT